MTSFAGISGEHAERVRVPRRRKRSSLKGRVARRGLTILSGILTRLPERPLAHVAWFIGGVLYRVQPGRRRLVHDNLERVVTYLAAHDMATTKAAAAAARDGRALDRLTRA